MSLDVDRLENLRVRGGKLIARCPACTEVGADRAGDHLFIADEGRGAFGCICNPGEQGHGHRQRIYELVGLANRRLAPILSTPRPFETRVHGPTLPTLRALTVAEMAAIAESRGWCSFAGLEVLTQRGLLWHGMVWDDGRKWPAWIIAESGRPNAQARRIDGQQWHGIGDKKAKTLPGSNPSWPIGASEIGARPDVCLIEGGPDFLAAPLQVWWENLPVDQFGFCCMTGAGNSISPDALPLFAGKRIRIAVHTDEPGREAAKRWADQLYGAGALEVDGFDFSGLVRPNGQPVEDLADFASCLDPEDPPARHIFADLGRGIDQ